MTRPIFFLATLLFAVAAFAGPKGQGFDIPHPLALSDPDLVLDEGAISTSLTYAGDSSRNNWCFYACLGMNKLSDRSLISIAFLNDTYEYDSGATHVKGGQTTFEVFYSKVIAKVAFPEVWYPSRYSLSWYVGTGYGRTETDISEDDVGGLRAYNPVVGIFGGDSISGATDLIPFTAGIIGNHSFGKRNGFIYYGHLGYDVMIQNTAFRETPVPVLTLGTEYSYRSVVEKMFPWELTSAFNYTIPSNDMDSSGLLGITLGIRRRW